MNLLNQKWIYVLVDGLLAVLTVYMAAILRFAGVVSHEYWVNMPSIAVVAAGSLVVGDFCVVPIIACGTIWALMRCFDSWALLVFQRWY